MLVAAGVVAEQDAPVDPPVAGQFGSFASVELQFVPYSPTSGGQLISDVRRHRLWPPANLDATKASRYDGGGT